MMVGVVGRLDPAKPEFAEYLGRFTKNPLYRGIRFARFFRNDGGNVVLDPAAVAGLKQLAEADLVLDTANPSMDLLHGNLLLADAVPTLRIVVDHLAGFDPTPEQLPAYHAVILELAQRPNVFVKLSQVYHPGGDGAVATAWEPIRDRLDYLFAAFGEDRLMFGSDYPNSYGVATIPQAVAVMKRFYDAKSTRAAEKYFWENSSRIYKWIKRLPVQPAVA